MSKDSNGREYAKVAYVTEGSILEADGGFTCIGKGAQCIVSKNSKGELSIPCADGGHSISGQLIGTDGTYYIGLYQTA